MAQQATSKLKIPVEVDSSKVKSGMNSAASSVETASQKITASTRKAANSSQSAFSGMAKSIQSAFSKTLIAVYAVIKAFSVFKESFKVITEFEQANADLSTILGKSTYAMQDLTDSARDLGRTTEYTASQVTQLQTELAKLGFDQKEIMGMQKAVLQFSTAVGAELPEAAALAGASLRMFGLEANDAEDALGTMAVATNKSALSFTYLQTAMSIVGPVAKTFGFSLKDTVTLLGTLANSGFDASSAATATRNILLNLADSSGKLAQSLGKPVKTFPELIEGLKKLRDQGVDLASALEMTDKRSVSAFTAFLDGADASNALRDALQDVDGELERISRDRLNTVEGSVKLLQSAWQDLILTFSNSKGVIKDTIDTLTNALISLQQLVAGDKGSGASIADRAKKNAEWYHNYFQTDADMYKALTEDIQKQQHQVDVLTKTAGTGFTLDRAAKKARKELPEAQAYLAVLQETQKILQGVSKADASAAGALGDTDTVTTTGLPTLSSPKSSTVKQLSAEELSRESIKMISTLDELEAAWNAGTLVWSDYISKLSQLAGASAAEAAEIAKADKEVADADREMYEQFRSMNGLDAINEALDENGLNYERWALQVEKSVEQFQKAQEKAKELASEFNTAVASGVSSAVQEMTDSLFGLQEFNSGKIFQALLDPLADMAIKEGELLVASGVGVEAIKSALESLNGWAAVTAGTALIALGAAVKSGLAALASTSSSAASNTTAVASSNTTTTTTSMERELTVNVTGTLQAKGSTLITVLNNEKKRAEYTN